MGKFVAKRPAANEAGAAGAKAHKGNDYWWTRGGGHEDDDDEDDSKKPSVMKRPAASGRAGDEENDEQGDDDDEGGPRHRMKGYYFKELLKSGNMDETVKKAWNAAKGNRKLETQVINSVMVPNSKGKRSFVVDTHAPAWIEALESELT